MTDSVLGCSIMCSRFRLWYLLGLMVLLSGGCVTDSIALRLYQDQNRFSLGEVRLGSNQKSALTIAKAHFKIDPVCVEQKVGNKNNKMASLEQTCTYSDLTNIYLSDQEVTKVTYFFVGAYLQQVNIELIPNNESSLNDTVHKLSESLKLQGESNGSLHKWVGSVDAALLIQQGNIKLRILPLKYLHENSKGPSIFWRS